MNMIVRDNRDMDEVLVKEFLPEGFLYVEEADSIR